MGYSSNHVISYTQKKKDPLIAMELDVGVSYV